MIEILKFMAFGGSAAVVFALTDHFIIDKHILPFFKRKLGNLMGILTTYGIILGLVAVIVYLFKVVI